MPDNRRRFALRENGEETSVFENKLPRQAALKVARRLEPKEDEADAETNPERIRLREHGTIEVHVYDAWAWEEKTPDDAPNWLGDTVTRADVSKVEVETTTRPEQELDYDCLAPLLLDAPTEVTQDKCDECGTLLEDGLKQVVPVRDVPDPKIAQYKRYHYECPNCTTETIAQQKKCPSVGGYGVNLLAQAVLFRYEYRIPYRKIADLFGQIYGCDISKGTVLHLCERVADVARTEYEDVKSDIQSAEILYADETPHSVGDSKYWLWAFTTGDETLFTFRDTRGSVVLEEVLGEEFSGIIVCDGHRAYPAFHSRLQRCWTHLLRGTDSLDEDDTEAWAIYQELQALFERLKMFLETEPTPVQRIIVRKAARKRMETLVATDVESEDAADVLTMLANGLGDWLTFISYPEVEPTNHKIEALLREPIVLRRIIGTLRNEKGMRLHETFLSLLRTWKQQDANAYTELRRLARKV